MTIGYSGISLESTMRFGRAKSILIVIKNNTVQFSGVRSKDLYYGMLWTLTFFFFFYLFFLILYFFSFEFLFLFIDDEEVCDIAVT